MKWQGFSGFKYYASVGVALVGLSAASTLLVDRVSMAQQPKVATTQLDEEKDELELAERVLSKQLGNDHPKLREVRLRLEAVKEMMAKTSDKVEAAKRVGVRNFSGSPLSLARVAANDGEVITEEIHGGDKTVVMRMMGDGTLLQDITTTAPREVRGFSMFGNPKQNSELQKAVEKLKGKESSEQDKTAAKEKIVSILGEQFDEDMEQRAKQIADLEKKIATLKEQIEKRKGAKSRMIDLRVEMLLNESEGLGFPSSWQQPAGVGPTPGASLFVPSEARTIRAFGTQIPPLPPTPPVAPTPPAPPAEGK